MRFFKSNKTKEKPLADKVGQALDKNLQKNLDLIKDLFSDCSDVVYRQLIVANKQAQLIFIDGLIDTKSIEFHAIKQLLSEVKLDHSIPEHLEEEIITINQVTVAKQIDEVVNHILTGNTVLLIDEMDQGFALEAKGGESRTVSEPETETSIRGPREGFTENLRVNTSLVRKKLRTNRLKMVSREVGTETKTGLVITYMEGLADPALVEEVLNRIDEIKIDGVLESGYIEELIEDDPWSLFPQVHNTERPDSVAANLLEGRVAIIINGTPFCLIVPTTFWQYLQASEDYYHRFHISIFLRWLRFVFIFIALLLPAIYIAISTYHQEMIPTNLLYSLAASREAIPFPAFIEAMIMEVAFEALREAGIRLPKLVGQAVSILGALVIGQAAVQAGIVSAPMVIIVSLTGIASFTIPRFNMAISVRLLRFPLMFLAAAFGLFGIVLGMLVIVAHLCKLRSFGVPYLSPVVPLSIKELKDVFIRAPWWSMESRPTQTIKGDVKRESTRKPSPQN